MSSLEALIDFAEARYARGDDHCAIRALRTVERRDSRNGEAAFLLGMALCGLGDVPKAAHTFGRAATLLPAEARIQSDWGISLSAEP